MTSSWTVLALLSVAGLVLVYVVCTAATATYRLYFHPLAGFPEREFERLHKLFGMSIHQFYFHFQAFFYQATS